MNRYTISILFILLNLAMIFSKRTAKLQIDKTSSFLSILKYSNFNVYFKTDKLTSESVAVEKVEATDYVWYIFGDFQSKFASTEFELKLISTLNSEEVNIVERASWVPSQDNNALLVKNYYFPEDCEKSKEAIVKIVQQGWIDNLLVLNFNYLCMIETKEIEIEVDEINSELASDQENITQQINIKVNKNGDKSAKKNKQAVLLKNEAFKIINPETNHKLINKESLNLVL